MTTDRTDFHDLVHEAIRTHGDSLDTAVPHFGELVSHHRRRTRRILASATMAIAAVGIAGIVLAASRTESADRGSSGTSEVAVGDVSSSEHEADGTVADSPMPSVIGSPPTRSTEFFCTDPLGNDRLGRALFGSCEPAITRDQSDFACTDRLGTDDTGRVRYATCEAIGQLGQLPGTADDAPFDNPDDLAVRSTTYVVQYADIPSAVAAEHCVSVDDLAAANGWSDPWGEFPVVGTEILVPLGFDDGRCVLTTYTITGDDTSRVRVADRFCVSVQSLDVANAMTEGYEAFYPGLEIVIPPTSDDTC